MNDCRRCLGAISAGILAICLFSAGLVMAASVPAWLDDGISRWNQENPTLPIQFVEISDSFVWYALPRTAELSSSEIRERIYAISEIHGYVRTAQEELLTTGKPPSGTNRHKAKKCWKRSFTLTVDVGQQRMLSTLICEDTDTWYMGFRILQ
jgi:hypothetical protein